MRQIHHRRHVHRQVRRPVRVGHAFHQRGVGVDHRRGDGRVVLLEALLERLDRLVRRRLGEEDLRAAAPDHDQAAEVVILLEGADVFAQLLGQVALVLALLDVRAVEALHVLAVEDGFPGLDGFELRPDLLEQVLLEHARVLRRLVAVVFEDVPAAEHDVVEVGEGDEVLDQGRAPVGPLAQADRAHLGDRANGAGDALADGEDAGDERGGDGPEADAHHAEFACRGCDFNRFFHGTKLYHGGWDSGSGARDIGIRDSGFAPIPVTGLA